MPITCVGSQKTTSLNRIWKKGRLKGDICGFKQNTNWQWDVLTLSAPEQHATTLSPLQQTVACVRGTLVRELLCNWSNLFPWPAGLRRLWHVWSHNPGKTSSHFPACVSWVAARWRSATFCVLSIAPKRPLTFALLDCQTPATPSECLASPRSGFGL